jgi:hypothetical protein
VGRVWRPCRLPDRFPPLSFLSGCSGRARARAGLLLAPSCPVHGGGPSMGSLCLYTMCTRFEQPALASPCSGRCAALGRSLGACALLAQQRAPAGGRGCSASLRAPLRVLRVPPRRWMPLVEESARRVSVVVRRAPAFCVDRRCVGPPPAPTCFRGDAANV